MRKEERVETSLINNYLWWSKNNSVYQRTLQSLCSWSALTFTSLFALQSSLRMCINVTRGRNVNEWYKISWHCCTCVGDEITFLPISSLAFSFYYFLFFIFSSIVCCPVFNSLLFFLLYKHVLYVKYIHFGDMKYLINIIAESGSRVSFYINVGVLICSHPCVTRMYIAHVIQMQWWNYTQENGNTKANEERKKNVSMTYASYQMDVSLCWL
jgi:hypothetical protein